MRYRDKDRVQKPTPTAQLSKQERQRYLAAARKRQNRRKLQSLNARLKHKGRRKNRGQQVTEPRRIITENWLENREWEAEKNKPVREIPAWLLPLIILVVLVMSLFVILPAVLSRLIDRSPADVTGPSVAIEDVYSDAYMVANKPVVDVFVAGNIRADRITQLLYNEPVERLSPKGSYATFYKVRLRDGSVGFVKRSDLDEDTSSIEPGNALAKLVVTDLSKRIMTHASNGNLLVEVKMNTELLVLYKADPLYRVKLPGGREGWLDTTGVIELGVNDTPAVAGFTYFTDSIMAFNYATLLQHGMSNAGISVPAAIHIAASVNGLDLPYDIEGIRESSTLISNTVNENGSLNYNSFQRGDLLFFTTEVAVGAGGDDEAAGDDAGAVADGAVDTDGQGEPGVSGEQTGSDTSSGSEVQTVTTVVVWVDYGIVLAERPREFVIRQTDINTILNEATFVEARRVFND